jgi:class 3 adenylate cyclase
MGLSIEQLREAGLYDPAEHDETDRLALIHWLEGLGFGREEMMQAAERGGLSAIAGDHRIVPGPRMGREEALRRSGLDGDEFDRFSTAFGFVPISGAPPGEVGYTSEEVAALTMASQFSAMFTPSEAVSMVRVIGSSFARMGEAAVSLFLVDIEDPHLSAGESELALAHKVYDAVGLLDGLLARLDPILRRHVMQAIERSRQASVGVERRQYRYAVGFVDLVGFTELTSTMGAAELTEFIRDFEARTYDIVLRAGARVVKLIGDEVMFVTVDVDAACRAAAALMEGFSVVDERVVPRGGIAFGDVLVRGGDYYGPVVNLASRLVDEAVPEEVLVTAEVERTASATTFEEGGRRMVKGFPTPVRVYSLAGP